MIERCICHDGAERTVYEFQGVKYYAENKKGGLWINAMTGEPLAVTDTHGKIHEVRYYREQFTYLLNGIWHNAEDHLATASASKPFPLAYFALVVVERAFAERERNETGFPYMFHIFAAVSECMYYSYSCTDKMLTVMILHDYLEDIIKRGEDMERTIRWMRHHFGTSITKIVLELTNIDKNANGMFDVVIKGKQKELNKTDYINHKNSTASTDALFCKMIDMTVNPFDGDTMPDMLDRLLNNWSFISEQRKRRGASIKKNWTQFHERVLKRAVDMFDDRYGLIVPYKPLIH